MSADDRFWPGSGLPLGYQRASNELRLPLPVAGRNDCFAAVAVAKIQNRGRPQTGDLRTFGTGHWLCPVISFRVGGIANAVERRSTSQVRSVKNTLTRTYSKLDQPAPPKMSKKATEEAAREALFSYYLVNKHSLPHEVLQVKEEIVELIMSGLPPDEAFATALGIEASDEPSDGTVEQG